MEHKRAVPAMYLDYYVMLSVFWYYHNHDISIVRVIVPALTEQLTRSVDKTTKL